MILPRRNEIDLEDVPEEVREAMTFIFADTVRQVIEAALEPDKKARKDGKPAKKSARRARARKTQKAGG